MSNALLSLTSRVLDVSEYRHRIIVPIKRLLYTGSLLFAFAVVLFTFTYTVTSIVTIPLLVYEGFLYYLFCKLRRSYHFSSVYLVAMPMVALMLSVAFKALIAHGR